MTRCVNAMNGIVRVVAVSVILLLAVMSAGCTSVVDGTVRAAPGLTPHPLTGQVVQQVLLDEAQLATTLHQSFTSSSIAQARVVGGSASDQMVDLDSSPRECAGVAFLLQKSSYRSAHVTDVGRVSWNNASSYADDPAAISVEEGVVAVHTADDADALFAQLSQQWQRCDGVTVNWYSPGGERFATAAISNVGAADSVLTATVQTDIIQYGPGLVANARALGVRANCLVEVDVAFFTDRLNNSATDIAHTMMDKISGLS